MVQTTILNSKLVFGLFYRGPLEPGNPGWTLVDDVATDLVEAVNTALDHADLYATDFDPRFVAENGAWVARSLTGHEYMIEVYNK